MDALDRPQHLVHQARVRAAYRDDDAERAGARRLGGARGGHHLVERQERVALGRRVVERRLRAEGAVLLAAAGLGADQRLQLDPLAPPAPAHLVGQREQAGQLHLGQLHELPRLVHLDRAHVVEQRALERVEDAHAVSSVSAVVTARRYQA